MRITHGLCWAGLALLAFGLSPSSAFAQTSVHGQGVQSFGPGFSDGHFAVNAWVDANGDAHGMINVTGAIPIGSLPKGGPADPWHIAVTAFIPIGGEGVFVIGVITHSLYPEDVGQEFGIIFGNDQIDFAPLKAGHIVVR
jgi:hypothetical protein